MTLLMVMLQTKVLNEQVLPAKFLALGKFAL
jgi:hypothetical protein